MIINDCDMAIREAGQNRLGDPCAKLFGPAPLTPDMREEDRHAGGLGWNSAVTPTFMRRFIEAAPAVRQRVRWRGVLFPPRRQPRGFDPAAGVRRLHGLSARYGLSILGMPVAEEHALICAIRPAAPVWLTICPLEALPSETPLNVIGLYPEVIRRQAACGRLEMQVVGRGRCTMEDAELGGTPTSPLSPVIVTLWGCQRQRPRRIWFGRAESAFRYVFRALRRGGTIEGYYCEADTADEDDDSEQAPLPITYSELS